MRGCPALMWKASPSARTANFWEAREEPFELEQERKLGDSCECVCWFPAAPGRGGQEGTALAAAVTGQVLLLGARDAPGSQGCAITAPTMQGKDAPPSLLSRQGRRMRRPKCKNHPTAMPARCTHTAIASMLFYPRLPMAPCVNTASTHMRARSGSSACKTHIWEAQLTSCIYFMQSGFY